MTFFFLPLVGSMNEGMQCGGNVSDDKVDFFFFQMVENSKDALEHRSLIFIIRL